MTAPEIATLLTASAALIGVIVTLITQRHRPTVDRTTARAAELQAASDLRVADLDILRGIIAELRIEVTALQVRVAAAEAYTRLLLRTWGTTPVPPPPPHLADIPASRPTNHEEQ